jgi:hypothetical protein
VLPVDGGLTLIRRPREEEFVPTITIVGVGDVGSAVAPLLADAGYRVRLATRRTPAELAEQGQADLLARPGVTAVPVAGAASDAEAVLLTVPYHAAAATLAELGDLDGTLVLDATNYNRDRDGDALDPGPSGTTAVLAERFPAAVWTKAFNMLWAGWLRTDARPGAEERVVFIAADDPAAATAVATIVRDAGFVPFLTGTLDEARDRQLEGTPGWNRRVTAVEAAALLPAAPGVVTARRS